MKRFCILTAAAAMAGMEIFPSAFGKAAPSPGLGAMTPRLGVPVLLRRDMVGDDAPVSPAGPGMMTPALELDGGSSEEEVSGVSSGEEVDEVSSEEEVDEASDEEEDNEVSPGFTKRASEPFGDATPEDEKDVEEVSSEEQVSEVSSEEEDDEVSTEEEDDELSSDEDGDEESLGFTKRDVGPFGNGILVKRGYCKPRPKPKPRTCPRKGHKLSNGSVCKKYKRCKRFKARDGCNTCKCVKGKAQCTKKRCPKPKPKPKPRTCPRKGHKLSNASVCKKYVACGQFKAKDKCNTCSCVRGQAQCTKKACFKPKPTPRTCPRKGHKLSNGAVCKKYVACSQFKARDRCNTCRCVRGQAQCTKKRCLKPKPKPRSCPRKGHKLSNGSVCKKYKGCRRFKARDGCNTCKCVKGRAQCTKKRCTKPTPKPKTKWCYYKKGTWHCKPRTPRCKLVH